MTCNHITTGSRNNKQKNNINRDDNNANSVGGCKCLFYCNNTILLLFLLALGVLIGTITIIYRTTTVWNNSNNNPSIVSSYTTSTTKIISRIKLLHNDFQYHQNYKFPTKGINKSNKSCPNYGYVKGRWIPTTTYNVPATVGVNFNATKTTPSQDNYNWVLDNPSECYFDKWDPLDFCNILNGRNMLIVGDSINYNLSNVIAGALGTDLGNTIKQMNWIDNNRDVAVHYSSRICNNTSTLTMIRNDYLTLTNHVQINATSKALLTPWTYLLDFHEITIVNSGAHAIEFDEYEKNLYEVKSYFDKHYTNGIVIFRTTPRGHKGCSKYTKPVYSYNSRQWYELFPDDDYNKSKSSTMSNTITTTNLLQKYGWWKSPHYNTMIKNIITGGNSPPDIFQTMTNKEASSELLHQTKDNVGWKHSTNTSYVILEKEDPNTSTLNNVTDDTTTTTTKSTTVGPYYAIIDIAPILELRPDIHLPEKNDCLHYKTAEPLQIFLQLLQNVLQGTIQF